MKVTDEHASSADFLRIKKLPDSLTTSNQLFAELLGDVEGKQLLTSGLLKGRRVVTKGVHRSRTALSKKRVDLGNETLGRGTIRVIGN